MDVNNRLCVIADTGGYTKLVLAARSLPWLLGKKPKHGLIT